MNPISLLRFLAGRLFRRQLLRNVTMQNFRDDQDSDDLAAVTAPHGPRPRSGGAMARPPVREQPVADDRLRR
jgi:hypothetical protein